MQQREKSPKVHNMVLTALMAAVICVLSPLTVPIGPVPLSFCNLAIFFALYLLGWKRGLSSLICYLVIGMVGVPVFSGFTGGFGKLLGPTGGYIVGYIPMAIVAGQFVEKTDSRLLHVVGMVLGTAICYALGTAWYCYEAGIELQKALWTCVIPFIPGDLAKIVIAMLLGPVLRKALSKAGFVI